jgi:hypothetical protein
VLAVLALRGGVHLLLAQLQPEVLDTAPEMLGPARDVPPPPPLTTDVLEAALGALVAYFRVAPLEVSLAAEELEAEEWLVARIPSWTRMQVPNTAPHNEPLGVRCSAAARHRDERSIRAPSRARAGGHPLGTARYCSVHAPFLVQCHIHHALLKVRGRAAQDNASARDDALDGARDGAALASVIPTPTNPPTPTRRVI